MKKPADLRHRLLRFLLHRLVASAIRFSHFPLSPCRKGGKPMQEEMEKKAVAISIKAGKLSANLLKAAIRKCLAEMEKSQKNPKVYKGKQSVKHLVRQGAGVSNIEVTDGNIKSFEQVARKYGVDFALKKDTTSQPPRYLVFFKSRDADALTAAFAEYSGKVVKRKAQEKPSVRGRIGAASGSCQKYGPIPSPEINIRRWSDEEAAENQHGPKCSKPVCPMLSLGCCVPSWEKPTG